MRPITVTLVGRASNLAYDDATGTATWTISVSHCSKPGLKVTAEFNLRSAHYHVLEQFNQMDDGRPISVIAHVPPGRELAPGVPLVVTHLEVWNQSAPVEVAA